MSVTDDTGCQITQNVTISSPDELLVENEITNETLSNQDGAIDVTPSGGTGPYSYYWTDGNGNFISDEEDISDLSAGDYTIEITDANGCIFTETYTVSSVVSIIDHEMAKKIKLFPNPTSGWITIELEDVSATFASIHVYSITGKMAISQPMVNISSGKYQLDLNEHASGIYIVRLLIEGSVVTKRIMLSK